MSQEAAHRKFPWKGFKIVVLHVYMTRNRPYSTNDRCFPKSRGGKYRETWISSQCSSSVCSAGRESDWKNSFFFCLSAGCADTVAAAQTPDSCISLASSICYLETSDFITADQCSCTPWLSPVLSVLSLRLHVNDRPRLYLIKIWQALLIIHSIVYPVSSSLHLPSSQSPSLTHPPGVHIHLHFRPSLHVQ